MDDSAVPDYAGRARLDGRRIMVVGAGQGIGRQVAHGASQLGARVCCVDVEPELAKQVAGEVGGVPAVADVREPADVERLVEEAAAELGGIDGLIDIVGMARYTPLLETSDEDWSWTHDMVVRHAFLLMRATGRAMAADGGGSMCFVASVSGISSAPQHSPYGVAKAGLMSLVRTGAVELGPKGIRVNAVAPGVVWTPRISAMLGDEARSGLEQIAPLNRIAEPADIASGLLFLMSDAAANVTGQTLVVDGGATSKFPYGMDDVG